MKKAPTTKKTLLEEARELFNNNHLVRLAQVAQCSKPTVAKILNEVNVGHPLFGTIAKAINDKREEIKRNQEAVDRLLENAA